jgi:hypothetical protein
MSTPTPQSLGKVAVLFGGSSAEREISIMSGSAVLAALCERGVDAHAFDPAERDLWELKRDGYARAFIALHGRGGEDGTIQGALECLGIPYTGSGVMASSVGMDKSTTTKIWKRHEIPTPDYMTIDPSTDIDEVLVALGQRLPDAAGRLQRWFALSDRVAALPRALRREPLLAMVDAELSTDVPAGFAVPRLMGFLEELDLDDRPTLLSGLLQVYDDDPRHWSDMVNAAVDLPRRMRRDPFAAIAHKLLVTREPLPDTSQSTSMMP